MICQVLTCVYIAESQLWSPSGPFDVCSLHDHPNVQAILLDGFHPCAFSTGLGGERCEYIGTTYDFDTDKVVKLRSPAGLRTMRVLKRYTRGYAWQHATPSTRCVYPRLRVDLTLSPAMMRRRR